MTKACQQLENLVRDHMEIHLSSLGFHKVSEKRSGDSGCAFRYEYGDLGLWIYIASGEINVVLDSPSESDEGMEFSKLQEENRIFLITAASYFEDDLSLGLGPIGEISSKSLGEQASFLGKLLSKHLAEIQVELRKGNPREFLERLRVHKSKRKDFIRRQIQEFES